MRTTLEGEAESKLASNPLKSKGFFWFLNQEWTQFWTASADVSRNRTKKIVDGYIRPAMWRL